MSGDSSPFRPAWGAVADAADIGGGTVLLDLGCGTGRFCAFAAGRGAIVHGLDVEPDSVAQARGRLPEADLRLGMMESLPWEDESFDVVTSFNALQYAMDPELSLMEAARVVRDLGSVAICKWAPPSQNQFFAFLASIGAGGVRAEDIPLSDPVEDVVYATGLDIVHTGDVPAAIEMADDAALEASLVRAGIEADPFAAPAMASIAAAAAPYRQADGRYRFDNRLTYWILRRHR